MKYSKVLIYGPPKSGKSRIVRQLFKLNNTFYEPTVNIDFYTYKTFEVTYNIWDCSGQISLKKILETYMVNTNIFILVTSSNNPYDSLQEVVEATKTLYPNITILHFHDPTFDDLERILK